MRPFVTFGLVLSALCLTPAAAVCNPAFGGVTVTVHIDRFKWSSAQPAARALISARDPTTSPPGTVFVVEEATSGGPPYLFKDTRPSPGPGPLAAAVDTDNVLKLAFKGESFTITCEACAPVITPGPISGTTVANGCQIAQLATKNCLEQTKAAGGDIFKPAACVAGSAAQTFSFVIA